MDLIELKTNKREVVGDGPAKQLRRQGKIPAVLYGPHTDSVLLSVAVTDLEPILKKGNIGRLLFKLIIDDVPGKPVMIKELQMHPLSADFLHVDFYEVDMEHKIKVSVPIIISGKCKGVEEGGMLQTVRREIDILCLPHEIPESLIIDVTDLDIGSSVHVKEIPLPGNVELPGDINFTILTVLIPKVESEETEEEELEEDGEATDEAKAEESVSEGDEK